MDLDLDLENLPEGNYVDLDSGDDTVNPLLMKEIKLVLKEEKNIVERKNSFSGSSNHDSDNPELSDGEIRGEAKGSCESCVHNNSEAGNKENGIDYSELVAVLKDSVKDNRLQRQSSKCSDSEKTKAKLRVKKERKSRRSKNSVLSDQSPKSKGWFYFSLLFTLIASLFSK